MPGQEAPGPGAPAAGRRQRCCATRSGPAPLPTPDVQEAHEPQHLEFAELFIIAIWLGFGVAAIALFFSRGLAGNILPSGGAALRVALIIVLVPLLLLLGCIAFLYAIIADSPNRPRGVRATTG